MTTEIVRIPFQGTEIHTALVDGEPRVLLRPTLENMGLDASAQLKKLKTRSWATVAETATVAEDGKVRPMSTVSLDTWAMLLANIDENRVNEAVRGLVIRYQMESAQALRDYWTKGGAINSRASEDQLASIIGRAKAQADVLGALRGLVDPAWLEAKARHVAARALGEEPEVDPATRPLTVGEFLEGKGLSAAEMRSLSSVLGRRLKGVYVGTHGVEPGKVDRFVDGALRSVFAYTEADRPLFEQAWQALTAAAGRT